MTEQPSQEASVEVGSQPTEMSEPSVLDGLHDLFPDETDDAGAEPAESEEAAASESEKAEVAVDEDAVGKASKGAEKRINQLVQRAKEAESAKQELEYKVEQYQAAFEILRAQLEAKNNRLLEIDDVSESQVELEQVKLQLLVQQKEAELEQKYQTKLQQAQLQTQIDAQKDILLAKVDEAISRYQGVSKQDIAIAWRNNPAAEPMDLAKQIYEVRLKAYEPEILKKVKPSPKTTAPTASKHSRKISTTEDLIAELDAEFGSDWNRR